MLSFRAPVVLFLKATTTTTITVPGYYRKDGTFVPPHQKLVHINPDKSKADVLAGKGSHSQKVAHSKLSKLTGWASMTEDEQHAHILSWATNYQQKQSAAAAVSGWKAAMLAGKKPKPAQQAAFDALDQAKKDALLAEVGAKPDPAANTKDAALQAAIDHLNEDAEQGDLPAHEQAEDAALVAKLEAAVGGASDDGAGAQAEEPAAEAGGAQAADENHETLKVKLQLLQDFLAGNPNSPNAPVWKQKISEIEAKVSPVSASNEPPKKAEIDISGWSDHAKAAFELRNQYGTLNHLDSKAVGAFKNKLRLLAKKTPIDDEKAVLILDGLATKVWGTDYNPKVADLQYGPPSSVHGAHADGLLYGKPAFDHMAQAAKSGQTPEAAASAWLADNPDGHAELSEALTDLGHADLAAEMDLPAPGSDETGAPAAATQPTDAEQHAAQNTIDDLVAGYGGHYPVKAAKAITAKLKDDPEFLASWSAITHVQRLQIIVDLAKEYQAAASASAAVSGWKKAAHAGKNPTPAQWKAFYALPAGKKAEMLSAVHAAAGGTGHLVAPAVAKDDPSAQDATGPKDGDTKTGANGQQLVFKNGRWHKVVAADEHGEVPPVLVPVDDDPATPEPAAESLAGKEAEWDVFHNTEPGHNKFWAVSVVGESMITHYGKIGAAGTTTVKHFKSYGAALAAASKLQIQKQAKGYAHKGVFQYPIPEGTKSAPKPASATVKQKPALESADGWQQTGGQQGSNPGGRFRDPAGQEWYIKTPASEAHAKNELLAAKLYAAAGIKVPDLKLVMKDGKVGIASKWQDGLSKAGHPDELALADGALSGFVADAWLANWDVTGLGLDNLLLDANGKAVRIDVGGSLLYRAQGEPKGDAFGDDVGELQSLLDPKTNGLSAALFGGMSKAAMQKSAERVLKITDQQITGLVQQFGPGSQAERAALAQKLIARKAALAKAFPKAKGSAPKAAKPKLDPTALPVNPNDLPPYHDFHNWNGPGKGLSSKSHINDANLKAEKDLHDFALKGNLIALKDYHFEAIDKETGASLGMQPIAKHPSQHVKLYHSDLVQYLDAIANPPEPLRVAEGNDPTQFKAEKLGKTISTVQANKKLGFWVALGKLAKAEPFVKYFVGKEKQVSSAYKTQAKAKGIDHLPKLARRFINRVQASGSYNDYFRDGHDSDNDGYSTAAIAAAAYAAATEKPAGTTIYRWQNMPESMVKQILAAEPGLVFQNPGSMCTSMSPTATSGFGQHRMVIHFAEGAKAVDSFASGGYGTEQEITTLMGQRFMLLRSEMSNNLGGIGKKGLEIHVLMLPPDPDYVADLQQRAATTSLKKAHRVFNELMGIEA